MRFQVIVGNIGTTLDTNNVVEANSEFAFYVHLSREGLGRAGGEDVTLVADGEIDDEHHAN